MLCDFQKHKIYTKIIDKNRVKMDSLQRRFSWIFLMKTSPNLSCIWKPLKWGFQNWSYMPKKSIFQGSYGCLKFAYGKRNFSVFIKKEITQIFIYHEQTLRGHNSLERWTFWACKTSFENLISRAFRCKKDLGRFSLRKSKKNGSEESPFLDDFYQWFWCIFYASENRIVFFLELKNSRSARQFRN